MADYIFDDWKTMLGNFQDCVQKDLEEIHKQKAEIQQMKADLFKEMEGFKYYRDEQRLILSAPEVIIGNVDESGDLMGCTGKIILKAMRYNSMEWGIPATSSVVPPASVR